MPAGVAPALVRPEFLPRRVHDARDRWSHVVTDGGAEHGHEFEFSWVRPGADLDFALDLDEYAFMLDPAADRTTSAANETPGRV